MRQLDRINKQKEIARKIVTLSSEIDFAIERNKSMKEQKELKRQTIINSKLKPKGSTSF